MKIGILTFHFGNNYGGILQCYALQQVLTNLGYEVEVIDYRPQLTRSLRSVAGRLCSVHSIKDLYYLLRENLTLNKNMDMELKQKKVEILAVFDRFRETYLRLSPYLNAETIGEYSNTHYDAIVVGSDQVWTSLYNGEAVYFLGWKPEFKGRRISYAACSAHSSVVGQRARVLKHLLERFDIITVRDNTTAHLVTSLIEETPSIVPDPSLLYAYEEFQTAHIVPEYPYILTYILGDEIKGGHATALEKIRQTVGDLPIYAISIPGNSSDIHNLADRVYQALSPAEWVAMFRHATFVYTDSFHAIMFSLKFCVPFVAYYRNMVRSSRLQDLKNRGIDSIYGSVEEMKIDISPKYSDISIIKEFSLKELF